MSDRPNDISEEEAAALIEQHGIVMVAETSYSWLRFLLGDGRVLTLWNATSDTPREWELAPATQIGTSRPFAVGDTCIVFDATAWDEAGGDQPDGNAQFYREAEIVELKLTPESGEQIATVRFHDGRLSHGHLTAAMRRRS